MSKFLRRLTPQLFLFLFTATLFCQVPTYYNQTDLNKMGSALKMELAALISSTHNQELTYTPGVWDALKQTDLDPEDSNNSKVLLIYGSDDTDGNYFTDRTRNKDANGGVAGSDWNREHTYPRSLGAPNLGSEGPGSDAHHLRASDVTLNANRDSNPFGSPDPNKSADGRGFVNAHNYNNHWFPGDEWKGDIARMMMYMYLRYGARCDINRVGNGSNSYSSEIPDIFLEWNASDPVSEVELQRNPILENIQGNRNPFIDNPAFATQIWGGPQAEDRFGSQEPVLIINEIDADTRSVSDATGDDELEFVELFDGGFGSIALDGFVIVFYNGNNSQSYNAIDLNGYATNSEGYFVMGNSGVANVDYVMPNNSIQNGADAIALYYGSATDFPTGTLVTETNLIDAVVHGTGDPDARDLIDVLTPSQNQVNEDGSQNKDYESIQRLPNGSGGLRKTSTFGTALPTPGFSNDIPDTESPSSPTMLQASNITGSTVDLNWENSTDNVGVTAYKIYQNNIEIGTSGTNSYTVNGLSSETTYSFKVSAIDASENESGFSNEVMVTTLVNSLEKTIAESRSLPDGTEVSVTGILSVVNQFGGPAFIQDETGGIAVFDALLHNSTFYNIGDVVTIVATRSSFNDQIQLGNISSITVNGSGTLLPVNISLSEMENYRGQLVRISDVSFPEPGASFSGNTNYSIMDNSGFGEMRIDQNASDLVGFQQPSGTCYSLIGVVGHYRGVNQLLPRFEEDFSCDSPPQILINEIDADQTGTGDAEFIELYDGGVGNTSLNGYLIVLYNGGGDEDYDAIDLDGFTTDENGYFVIGSSTVANVDLVEFTTNGLQNGADAVALYLGDATDFPENTPPTQINLIDAIVYDTDDADDSGLLEILTPGQPQVNENGNGGKDTESLQRLPNGSGGALNTIIYAAASPTPGVSNGGTMDTESPSIPINVLASNETSSTIDLSWDASTDNIGVTGYLIYQDDALVGNTAELNFQATELDPETTYSFSISAVDDAGNESDKSIAVLATTLSEGGEEGDLILYQGFEESIDDNWDYTNDPVNCNSSGDVWDIVTSVGSINTAAVGNQFFGVQDLEGLCGTSAGGTITMNAVDLTDYEDVMISFAINVDGFDVSNGDIINYEFFYDGMSQGEVQFTTTSTFSTAGWETISESIPNTVTSVSLQIFVKQNGGSDYAGFDDFKVVGIPLEQCAPSASELIITGVYDGTRSGGTPKGVELYATEDILDLSIFGLGSANNGGGTDGEEFTFPNVSVSAGDYIYVAMESTEFQDFFGFTPDYTHGSMAINGDDAIELFKNGSVVDVFGDINVDGNGQLWEYLDGWAYRVDKTGADGTNFDAENWKFSGANAWDGETTNTSAISMMPIGTYQGCGVSIEPDTEAPSMPMNLKVNNETTNSIDLSWEVSTDNVGVTGYRIFVDDVEVAISTTNFYSVTGLNAETTYEFKVSSYDAAGNESAPGTVMGTTLAEDGDGSITIAQARQTSDGTVVKVHGTITVSDQLGGPAFIQDKTGGIAVFDAQLHGEMVFEIGDSVTILASRSSFNDQVQLGAITEIIDHGPANAPVQPRVITAAQLSDYAGQLVRVMDVSFENSASFFCGETNYDFSDMSAESELRIDEDIEGIIGSVVPETCSNITGVVGRFRSFYQLLPRFASDLPCSGTYSPHINPNGESSDLSLDILTWNIEWFGDGSNFGTPSGTSSPEIQKDAVKSVILDIQPDLIAVQEIANPSLFTTLVSELPGYAAQLSNATSYPNDNSGPKQQIGFIYKTDVITPTRFEALLESVHPYYNGGDASAISDFPDVDKTRFFASGRLPFMMTANVSVDGLTEEIKFIVYHARANGSSESQSRYDMRKYDVEYLKSYLDMEFAEDNLVLLGDFNDDVDFTVADGVNTTESTYSTFVNDSDHYGVVTSTLSNSGYNSYAFENDMIDHILVSNELFDNFIMSSETIWNAYYDCDFTNTTSDHFPVSARFEILQTLEILDIYSENVYCYDDSTGVVEIAVQGGVPPYAYSLDGIEYQEEEVFMGLKAGVYSIFVKDASGIIIESEKIFIEQPEELVALVSGDNKVYYGYDPYSTALLAVDNIFGGVGPYSYLWNTGDTTNQIEVSPTSHTIYEVTITDNLGCSKTFTIEVEVEDVTCGKNKIMVCYKNKVHCVNYKSVEKFMAKGAVLGSCSPESASKITLPDLYPNPVFQELNLNVNSTELRSVDILIYNQQGQMVNKGTFELKRGNNLIKLDFYTFSNGFYFVQMNSKNGFSEVYKVLKISR